MKKLQITRNSPDHDGLVELYKKEKNIKLKERYQALYLMIELKNCSKVAKLIKKSRTTIQTWVNIFNKGGLEAIVPVSPPGRPSRLTKDQKKLLKTDVSMHPRDLGYDFSNWEGKKVSEHIKNKFGVLLKVRQCQYLLHELGLTLQRPIYKFTKADPEEQEEFIQTLKKKKIQLC
ncbi:MAG: transposase [Promethearchaeota archaeon]